MKAFLPLLGALCVTGCAWVETTAQGEAVTLVEARHVGRCQSLGSVTATTRDRFGAVPRKREIVAEELADLARNKAATLGGDSIVAEGEASEGSRTFRVYRCAG